MNVNQIYFLNLSIKMFEVILDFILVIYDFDRGGAAVLILILMGRRVGWGVIGVVGGGRSGGRTERRGRKGSVSGFIR